VGVAAVVVKGHGDVDGALGRVVDDFELQAFKERP
jgi:hypothetical protein